MDDRMTNKDREARKEVLLSKFVQWFESFCHDGRPMLDEAERACDYRDGNQLTAEQIAALKKRKQPPVVFNRVKRKIDYLVGLEKQQRTDPKALPRTPQHQDDAHAATDALRYQTQTYGYDNVRSGAWFDIISVGWGGTTKQLYQKQDGSTSWRPVQTPWDRMWWDINSSALDFSDANYRGELRWMDFEEAIHEYGDDKREELEQAKQDAVQQEHSSFQDKPHTVWYDRSKDRLCIVRVFYKDKGVWKFAEFTRGALLTGGISPFVDDDGFPTHPYEWRTAYIDRKNHRFGLIRELFDPQDEINKRRSKLLHALNSNKTFMKPSAVPSERKFRAEMAKPDGNVVINESATWGQDVGPVEDGADVSGHASLLAEAKSEIDALGANAALQGKNEQALSGKALQTQQQGGLIEMGGLLDALRDMDKENYRMDWRLIRKYWTAPKWIRVTDDPKNVKFIGLNAPYQDPQTGQVRMVDVAELDVDILIEDAPNAVELEGEQFEQVVGLAQAGVIFPPEVYLEMAPNIRNKDKLLDVLRQQQQAAAQQPSPDMIEMERKNAETQADIQYKDAQTKKTLIEAAKEAASASVGAY